MNDQTQQPPWQRRYDLQGDSPEYAMEPPSPGSTRAGEAGAHTPAFPYSIELTPPREIPDPAHHPIPMTHAFLVAFFLVGCAYGFLLALDKIFGRRK